jgi:hypothetical protein
MGTSTKYTWIGKTGASWSEASNWQTGDGINQIPQNGSDIIINETSSVNITYDETLNFNYNSLTTNQNLTITNSGNNNLSFILPKTIIINGGLNDGGVQITFEVGVETAGQNVVINSTGFSSQVNFSDGLIGSDTIILNQASLSIYCRDSTLYFSGSILLYNSSLNVYPSESIESISESYIGLLSIDSTSSFFIRSVSEAILSIDILNIVGQFYLVGSSNVQINNGLYQSSSSSIIYELDSNNVGINIHQDAYAIINGQLNATIEKTDLSSPISLITYLSGATVQVVSSEKNVCSFASGNNVCAIENNTDGFTATFTSS